MSDEQQMDFLEMSDEEFLNADPATLLAPAPGDKPAEDDATRTNDASAEAGAAGAEDDGEGDDGDAGEETPQGNAGAGPDPDAGEGDPAAGEQTPVAEKPADTGFDYKTAYEQITAPFKANGKEMHVTDPADIKQLLQMGANYNKKMVALKPHLQIVKMLENHGLLDESKLSYLIDIDKKNPEAIKKLVKDSGMDPLDMDVSKDSDYKPKTYTADEREVELDQVLDEIQDTPTYAKTSDLIGNKWDAASKRIVANAPQLLRVINDHMANGVYDVISTEVERERMLGRLTGMSDVDAYRKVGDTIQARGGFDHLFQAQPDPDVVPPQPPAEEARRNDRRRAAGSTSATPAPAKPADFNPLAMSDEEFAKQMNGKFL